MSDYTAIDPLTDEQSAGGDRGRLVSLILRCNYHAPVLLCLLNGLREIAVLPIKPIFELITEATACTGLAICSLQACRMAGTGLKVIALLLESSGLDL